MVLFRSFQVVRTKLGLLCRKGGSLKLRDKPAFPKLTPNLPKSQVVSTGDFGKFNPAICPQWQLTENVTSQALRDFTSGFGGHPTRASKFAFQPLNSHLGDGSSRSRIEPSHRQSGSFGSPVAFKSAKLKLSIRSRRDLHCRRRGHCRDAPIRLKS